MSRGDMPVPTEAVTIMSGTGLRLYHQCPNEADMGRRVEFAALYADLHAHRTALLRLVRQI